VESDLELVEKSIKESELKRLGLDFLGEQQLEQFLLEVENNQSASLDSDFAKHFAEATVKKKNQAVLFASHLSTTEASVNEKKNQDARVQHAAMQLSFILKQTASHSMQDFIDRFSEATKLTESMLSHQAMLEARVAQLKLEMESLHEENIAGSSSESSGLQQSTGADGSLVDAPVVMEVRLVASFLSFFFFFCPLPACLSFFVFLVFLWLTLLQFTCLFVSSFPISLFSYSWTRDTSITRCSKLSCA
jgi:hypothetical protein